MKWIVKPTKQVTTLGYCGIRIDICGARYNV